jgi:hypothetical protein
MIVEIKTQDNEQKISPQTHEVKRLQAEPSSNTPQKISFISLENFLSNTTSSEVFCLLHEFKDRINELREQDTNFFLSVNKLEPTDRDLKRIADIMIKDIKECVWL